jgi:hypothetical protein
MVIYKITNLVNGKVYVGKRAYSKEKFLKSYYYGSGKYITLAIKKYGKWNFSKEVIEECESLEDMGKREKYWIKELDTMRPNGYNLCIGGNGAVGYHHTEEWKYEMSKLRRGKKHSEEWCRRISESNKGKKRSEEIREKMRKSHLGIPLSEKHKQGLSKSHRGEKNYWFGKKLSEEHKRKLSISHSLLVGEKSPSFGRKVSEETKQKIRASLIEMWRIKKLSKGMLNNEQS